MFKQKLWVIGEWSFIDGALESPNLTSNKFHQSKEEYGHPVTLIHSFTPLPKKGGRVLVRRNMGRKAGPRERVMGGYAG